MDTQGQHQQPDAAQPELNMFGKLTLKFLQYGQNASNNMQGAFKEMSLQQWIRLIVVVGAYLLLRPYAMKWLGGRQLDAMDKDDKKEKAARITANQLRGEKGPVDLDELEEEDLGDGTATDWGSRARVRQRTMIKHLMEADERRRQEDDDDQDIADLLED